jgi:hypothetical protein
MTIKPVLVPDHDAADLRKLMDHFATAAQTATPAAQANRIRQQLQEARPDVEEGINEDLSPEIKKLNKTYKKLFSIIAYDKNGKKLMSGPKAHKEVSRQLGVDPDDMDEYLRLEYYDFFDTVNKEWEKQKGNRKEHYSNEIYGKVDADSTKIKEARPDVIRQCWRLCWRDSRIQSQFFLRLPNFPGMGSQKGPEGPFLLSNPINIELNN